LPFLFWQYTDGGVVDGINLNGKPQQRNITDRSVGLFDNVDKLVAWCGAAAVA